MNQRKNLKITQDQLENILNKDWDFYQNKILKNCYCGSCGSSGNATIVKYEVFVNNINDIIFKGFCQKCGAKIARYCETGENAEMSNRINEMLIDS